MKNLFEKGLSFRSFMFNVDDVNKKKFMKYYIPMEIADEVKNKITALEEEINILGVVESWCPDCHINLSVLEKMISFNDKITLRLVTRDNVNDELDDYKEDGKIKVPTFIIMDKDFNIRGAFIEKIDKVKNADIETLEGSKINMQYKAGKFINETAEDLLKIIIGA
ncbi:thioredoxin family protein [Lutispora thermophila]|uniref:Thioredoxin n=1 Tax=Lutispora thermophila DSM 19022 TaxID=1122184 RepID=A0A1M6IBZ6_9FIRM|nr:thioredoxin family protein [Lutispora thermophila]SHJ31958.1 Thioredoxin [Lutispora thermophila DSM 19022]